MSLQLINIFETNSLVWISIDQLRDKIFAVTIVNIIKIIILIDDIVEHLLVRLALE